MKARAVLARLGEVRRLRWLKLCVAGLLLAALYFAADWRKVFAALSTLDSRYLLAALALFVPQTLLSAWRWKALVRDAVYVTLPDALRQTLVASAANLVLPSKTGDLLKASMLPPVEYGSERTPYAAALVEKLVDAFLLLALVVLGASGYGGSLLVGLLAVLIASAALRERQLRSEWRSALDLRPPRLSHRAFLALSLALWTLHMVQIDLMLKAAGAFVPWSTALARLPLALFAGMLPVSFCGIGTRDTALIVLFRDTSSASTMAAVGLLTALRYLVPGAVGIPVWLAWRRREQMRAAVEDVLASKLEPPHRRGGIRDALLVR